ncbi:hypothetical protein [Endozoicomonas sp. 8E]|uniref:hypothetical protein n=1 Tax=Endozoicomonas sp. 8E TaxID=3035692 RepID=UPI002939094D|nr:hypothetical protein [Endozoicomonas sp. 8E]WOG28991.1 hypothetical protein P6910_04830 [Endozoicomonas sp. 8E]
MKRVSGVLPVLILSIAVMHSAIAFAVDQRQGGLTQSDSKQSKNETLLPSVMGPTSPSGDSKAEKRDSVDTSSGQIDIDNSSNALLQDTQDPVNYQKAIIDQNNLIPFDVDEDNYTDAKKKPTYLWIRATYFESPDPLPKGGPQPALFSLNTAYNPAFPYGAADQSCLSPLPEPFAKSCNDQQETGFCRVKFKRDDRVDTVVGMLANTPDNFSGCLLSNRGADGFLRSLGDTSVLPKNILVTDKEYYQVNVIYGGVSYRFREEPRLPVPFASTVLLSGSLHHETLCKSGASPGIQWYSDYSGGVRASGYGCAGLTPYADSRSDMLHFIPIRKKAHPVKQSPVVWRAMEPEEDIRGAINFEVNEYFCSPRKPYKEFILGSLAGQGSKKYCGYIGTNGKTGYVATNQDGSIATDYLKPVIDGYVGWQDFEGDLPDKAIIAGYSVASSGRRMDKVPVYFCRFKNNGFKTYGKYFKKGKVCKTSFATPCGDSNALVTSDTFKILVRK